MKDKLNAILIKCIIGCVVGLLFGSLLLCFESTLFLEPFAVTIMVLSSTGLIAFPFVLAGINNYL